ncbi:MAG: hypothetical protein AB7G93_02620 [Bdellovibrionales bacterium]
MKKPIRMLALCAGLVISATAAAEVTYETVEEGCLTAASEAFEKAKSDSLKLAAAFGGNISSEYVKSIEDSREGFVMLHSNSCIADMIRKFKIETPYSMD